MLQFKLDDIWVWVWLASVWGGGWLFTKALLLHPHVLDYIFGDMSDGDRRALTLVSGAAVFVLVYAAFYAAFFETSSVDIIQFIAADESGATSLFWTGPVSLVVGVIALAISHVFEKKSKSEEKIYSNHAKYLAEKNAILDFVKKANERRNFTMLTLRNRKVYIGVPQRVSDWKNPRPSSQHLYFVPLQSGYRKRDSLELKITTKYAKAYDKSVNEGGPYSEEEARARLNAKIPGWEIIIPVNEIVNMQNFDRDLYKEIRRTNRPRKK